MKPILFSLCFFLALSSVVAQTTANDWLLKGDEYTRQNDFAMAIAAYTNAILKDTKSDIGYRRRAKLYHKTANYSAAIRDLDMAASITSSDAEIFYTRAIFKSALGDFRDAIADHTHAIQLRPNYVNAYNDRGFCYYQIEKYSDALTDYNIAISQDASRPEFYCNKGMTLMQLQKHKEAIESYTKSIDLNYVDKHLAYSGRAFSKEKIGQCTSAIIDYQTALELKPAYYFATENLKRLQEKCRS